MIALRQTRDLTPMITAARQAAALTRRVQALSANGMLKEDEPVTLADYGAQAILCRAVAHDYPNDAVIAEERGDQFLALVTATDQVRIAGIVSDVLGEPCTPDDLARWMNAGTDRQSDTTWAIDPVDGTKGFLAGRRYSIACGLLVDGLPVAGVLACPGYPTDGDHGLLFHAQGSIARMEKLSGGLSYRIAVSPSPRGLQNVRAVASVEREHADRNGFLALLKSARLRDAKIEYVDSQDKYAMVACGDADLYVRLPIGAREHRVWDHAAGVAIVHAAGGAATDLDGSPLDFTQGRTLSRNRGMVVSSGGELHERCIEALTRLSREQAT